MLHVFSSGSFVATINRQSKGADTYRKEAPVLLLHNTGRIDRFPTMKDAKGEAVKTWPRVAFKRGAE